jgi:hypothetical protein
VDRTVRRVKIGTGNLKNQSKLLLNFKQKLILGKKNQNPLHFHTDRDNWDNSWKKLCSIHPNVEGTLDNFINFPKEN